MPVTLIWGEGLFFIDFSNTFVLNAYPTVDLGLPSVVELQVSQSAGLAAGLAASLADWRASRITSKDTVCSATHLPLAPVQSCPSIWSSPLTQ